MVCLVYFYVGLKNIIRICILRFFNTKKFHFRSKIRQILIPNFQLSERTLMCYKERLFCYSNPKHVTDKVSSWLEAWKYFKLNVKIKLTPNIPTNSLAEAKRWCTKSKKEILKSPKNTTLGTSSGVDLQVHQRVKSVKVAGLGCMVKLKFSCQLRPQQSENCQ